MSLLALKIYSLSLIPLAFFTVYSAVLRAHERMDLYLLLSAVAAVLQLGGVWWVLQGNRSLTALVMILDGVQLLIAIFAGVLCQRYLPAFHFRWMIERRQLAAPRAFGVAVCVARRVGRDLSTPRCADAVHAGDGSRAPVGMPPPAASSSR